MHKATQKLETETNPTVWKRLYYWAVKNKDGRCHFCGMHRGMDNQKRVAKHGVKKPKSKDHRRK